MGKALAVILAIIGCSLAGPPTAGAEPDAVVVSATANGHNVNGSSQADPVRLRPGEPVDIVIAVTNGGNSPIEITRVEFAGRVVGLTFFSYATTVDFTVPPGRSDTLRYRLDLTGLSGQATGLMGGRLTVVGAAGDAVATIPVVTDVRGSLLSVYGLFGVALVVLTALALVDAAFGIARQRLSGNRWQRGLRLLVPGIGVGLVLTFSASVARLWVPEGSRWLLLGGLAAAIFFAVGYFAPLPLADEPGDDPDTDLDLAAHVVTEQLAK